jgi:hypothetical protein
MIAATDLTRIIHERDRQDVHDRRDAKFWVRSPGNLELQTSNSLPSRSSRFSRKSRANNERRLIIQLLFVKGEQRDSVSIESVTTSAQRQSI